MVSENDKGGCTVRTRCLGFQQCLKVPHIVVAIADLAQARGIAPGMKTGMVEAVGEDQRPRPVNAGIQQGRQDRDIGLITGSKYQGRFRALAAGEFPFHSRKGFKVTAHQPRGAAARAPVFSPSSASLDQLGMAGQPQIVVGGDIHQFAPVHHHPSGGQARACGIRFSGGRESHLTQDPAPSRGFQPVTKICEDTLRHPWRLYKKKDPFFSCLRPEMSIPGIPSRGIHVRIHSRNSQSKSVAKIFTTAAIPFIWNKNRKYLYCIGYTYRPMMAP